MSPSSSGFKHKPSKEPARKQVASKAWKQNVPPKCWLTFNGPHSTVAQKTTLFQTFHLISTILAQL
jgi:hypothetical protein